MTFLLSSFMQANRRACRWVESLLPAGFRANLHRRYEPIVSAHIDALSHPVVIDVGAGRQCPYLKFVGDGREPYVVGIDSCEEEIRHNQDISAPIVGDVTAALPFAANSVDIITSRSVLEHLKDTASFIGQCSDTMVDGGIMIHCCPCRFSPFALINQMVPNRLAKFLLALFHPEWAEDCGFVAYYNNCWYSRLTNVMKSHGFEIVAREFRYYQAIYFDFFLPAYVIMLSYDLLIYALGIKNVACQMIIVARKLPTRTGSIVSRPVQRAAPVLEAAGGAARRGTAA